MVFVSMSLGHIVSHYIIDISASLVDRGVMLGEFGFVGYYLLTVNKCHQLSVHVMFTDMLTGIKIMDAATCMTSADLTRQAQFFEFSRLL